VYPHVATGFTDSNAYLRELTLKSMLVLAPKLSQKALNQSLLKYLAKLQARRRGAWPAPTLPCGGRCRWGCVRRGLVWPCLCQSERQGLQGGFSIYRGGGWPAAPARMCTSLGACVARARRRARVLCCAGMCSPRWDTGPRALPRAARGAAAAVIASRGTRRGGAGGRGAGHPREHDHPAGQPGAAPGRGGLPARAAQRVHARAQGLVPARARGRAEGAPRAPADEQLSWVTAWAEGRMSARRRRAAEHACRGWRCFRARRP